MFYSSAIDLEMRRGTHLTSLVKDSKTVSSHKDRRGSRTPFSVRRDIFAVSGRRSRTLGQSHKLKLSIVGSLIVSF